MSHVLGQRAIEQGVLVVGGSATGLQLAQEIQRTRDGKAQFSGSLRNVCALADLKMNRLLESIDGWAARNGLAAAPQRHDVDRQTAIPQEAGRGQRM